MTTTLTTPWICAQCGAPIQSYFDYTEHLACATCFPGAATYMDVSPQRWGGDPSGLPIRIQFEKIRGTDFKAHDPRWFPVPCVDPTVNARMADLLRVEGLEGCFVKPATVTIREPVSANVATIPQFSMRPGFFAATINDALAEYRRVMGTCIQEPQPEGVHYCGIMCYAIGCKIGGINPLVPRPWLVDRSTFVGPGLASGLAMEQMAAEQDAIAPLSPAAEAELTAYLHGGMRAAEEVVAKAWWDAPVNAPQTPLDRSVWDFAPDPKTQSTPGDVRGRLTMTGETSPGCRLGCACPVHKPARPAPWVPSVDDWDLLPDAWERG